MECNFETLGKSQTWHEFRLTNSPGNTCRCTNECMMGLMVYSQWIEIGTVQNADPPPLNGHDLWEIYRTGVKSCKFLVNYGMHWGCGGKLFNLVHWDWYRDQMERKVPCRNVLRQHSAIGTRTHCFLLFQSHSSYWSQSCSHVALISYNILIFQLHAARYFTLPIKIK